MLARRRLGLGVLTSLSAVCAALARSDGLQQLAWPSGCHSHPALPSRRACSPQSTAVLAALAGFTVTLFLFRHWPVPCLIPFRSSMYAQTRLTWSSARSSNALRIAAVRPTLGRVGGFWRWRQVCRRRRKSSVATRSSAYSDRWRGRRRQRDGTGSGNCRATGLPTLGVS
jgi:hypothetical protein